MKSLLIAVMMFAAVSVMGQSIPTQIEGSSTNEFTQVNGLGRPYQIVGFVSAVRGDTTTTNTATIAIVNTQNVDLTGTNATPAAVTYTLKESGDYTGQYTWLPTTEQPRVPAGATLKITFTGSSTNDFILFRDER